MMMKKYEVIAERVSLVVGKGSIVYVEDAQAELAKQFLKPLEKKVETAVDETEKEVAIEKKSKKK